jgi:hypothetical protein
VLRWGNLHVEEGGLRWPFYDRRGERNRGRGGGSRVVAKEERGGARPRPVLAAKKCIYLPPTYPYFIQDIEYRCLLLTSSMNFVDLPFQEHRILEKHHMD